MYVEDQIASQKSFLNMMSGVPNEYTGNSRRRTIKTGARVVEKATPMGIHLAPA